jgi:cytochrome b561
MKNMTKSWDESYADLVAYHKKQGIVMLPNLVTRIIRKWENGWLFSYKNILLLHPLSVPYEKDCNEKF